MLSAFLGIMVLGCHNVLMSNQSTFVLAYLLLQGYDVTGHSYMTRITGLALGAAVCALVFHIRHRGRVYKKVSHICSGNFPYARQDTVVYPPDARRIFRNADRLAASYPSCHVVGIASKPVLLPFAEVIKYRVRRLRTLNILGFAIFLLLFHTPAPKACMPLSD